MNAAKASCILNTKASSGLNASTAAYEPTATCIGDWPCVMHRSGCKAHQRVCHNAAFRNEQTSTFLLRQRSFGQECSQWVSFWRMT